MAEPEEPKQDIAPPHGVEEQCEPSQPQEARTEGAEVPIAMQARVSVTTTGVLAPAPYHQGEPDPNEERALDFLAWLGRERKWRLHFQVPHPIEGHRPLSAYPPAAAAECLREAVQDWARQRKGKG